MSSPISAFTAVPNPQMLAFMATQSFLMMQMAGAGWQYGKRKISAMKNEEFNALTVTSLLQSETADVRAAIPTIIQSINDMTPMVGHIVAQYGDFIKEIIKATPQLVSNIYQPEHKPSLETFNPLAIINPLLPAFSDDSSFKGTSPGVGTDAISSGGASASAVERNNMIKWLRNIRNASVETLRNFHPTTLGITPANVTILQNAIQRRNNDLLNKVKPIRKSLPISTNILEKTRVSKQTLRRQRTLLISNVRSAKAELSRNTNRLSSVRTDPRKRQAQMIKVNRSRASLKTVQQKLANFLDRWKNVKY